MCYLSCIFDVYFFGISLGKLYFFCEWVDVRWGVFYCDEVGVCDFEGCVFYR